MHMPHTFWCGACVFGTISPLLLFNPEILSMVFAKRGDTRH